MRVLFFFATYREAAATIKKLGAVKNDVCEGTYRFSRGEILVCGMGVEAVTRVAARAPSQGCCWVNIGLAGSLDTAVAMGTAVSIGSTMMLEWNCEHNAYGPVGEGIELCSSSSARLFTSPVPLYSSPLVPRAFSFIDMEGYALARTAKERAAPLSMVKIVSDYCTSSSHTTILENLDVLSERIAEEAVRALSTRPQASTRRLGA
jgi:nucleoside phosphorylase